MIGMSHPGCEAEDDPEATTFSNRAPVLATSVRMRVSLHARLGRRARLRIGRVDPRHLPITITFETAVFQDEKHMFAGLLTS